MIESILYKNVEIVLPSGIRQGDVFVKNGKISKIDWSISASAELTINDSGLTLMPGVIDTHVHFREPGAEHKENISSGSRAAVSGGVTSFCDMPNTRPSATTIKEIQHKKDLAAKSSLANYNFYIGATPDNIHELQSVENVAGIKIFVGSSTGSLLVDKEEDIRQIFQNTKHLIAVHSEDEAMVQANAERLRNETSVHTHYKIRNVDAAVKCTKILIQIAQEYNKRLHILHLTTAEEMQIIAQAKHNSKITTEVSPQHLLLYAPDIYNKIDTFAQINPPIREKRHADALWKGLKSGVIDMIATDHAPHTIEEKQQGYPKAPCGMPGVETALPLMLSKVANNECRLESVVKWMCEGPAKTYKISKKGAIQIGYDADLVLIDRKKKHRISKENTVSKCGWSAFEGWEVTGLPIATFVNGNMVYREGEFFESIKGTEIKFNSH